MTTIEVFVPTASQRTTERALAPRLTGLAGANIGWLDNMKANASELLREVSRTLASSGAAFRQVVRSKNATAPAPESVLAHLETCDAVVLAIAD